VPARRRRKRAGRPRPGARPEAGLLTFPAMSISEVPAAFHNAPGIGAPLTLLRQALTEISSRRRLVRYLVSADMKKRGTDTLLGNLWWILDPLLQMVVYVIFVTILARASIPDYPLFIFAAILPWKWFNAAVIDATGAIVRQERLIRQIAFPKIVLPVATVTAGTVGFAWGLIPLAAIMLVYHDRLSLMLLWIPVIAAVQYVFTLAVAILVSAANVFFRDLGNVAGHVLRLWWFLSPGLYSLTALDNIHFIRDRPILRDLAGANPFAILFESYRTVIYGTDAGGPPTIPNLLGLLGLLIGSLVLLALCAILFKRLEPDFAKVL
jgi:homopolymeric O-antigen transport system permease protein